MSVSTRDLQFAGHESASLSERLNTRWHKAALQLFMAIVLFHWAEHLIQAYQLWGLHWTRAQSMGLLGMYYPWLMKTETLHYGFALVMLIGLWVLRKGFTGTSYKWWMVSFWIQFWHHFEHFILFYQANTHSYWFGGKVPTSVGQIWIPRIELHLIYNTLVFIPMVVAMYYHVYPPARDAVKMMCTCARHRHHPVAAAA
ncbi:MAG TPA: hypothetical protein VJ852_11705 [Gemmatimonadaceae bacterium]|nr:hypothetical protein [Gemmatimonadaceae bacterium]